jgi:hypothetical protein
MTTDPSCVKEGSVASGLEGVGLSVRALDLSLLKRSAANRFWIGKRACGERREAKWKLSL